MGTEVPRYSFRDVPGPTVTVSFRIPEVAALILEELLPEAEGVTNRTEALQDALVKWIMLEELYRARRRAALQEEDGGST